ncbi:calcium-binding protein [Kordiimonas sp.]|uniref:calcium-binding protein n=1 Tax=Kordiimonas sp. TaxID=1970157 RepID=UPI003A923BA4
MSLYKASLAALVLAVAAPEMALAQSAHGHNGPVQGGGNAGPTMRQPDKMENSTDSMMGMMMQMHAQMMGSGMKGGMPDMFSNSAMSMMDGQMMTMMMGPGMMSMGSQQNMNPESARIAMTSRLEEFDADGDGSLSLLEFEELHSAMIRESTVDKFQFLDADGDGQITGEEMSAPANRLQMRKNRPDEMGGMSENKPMTK